MLTEQHLSKNQGKAPEKQKHLLNREKYKISAGVSKEICLAYKERRLFFCRIRINFPEN